MTDRIASERGSATAPAPIDCDRFDTLLPEYLEHDLAPNDRAAAVAHLAECARCRALVDDLGAISRAAAALPPLEPERDLWAGIAARIEAPVVPLGRTGEQPVPTLRDANFRVERATVRPRPVHRLMQSTRWLAAAAGVLVAVSVGSTYVVMRVAGRSAPTTLASAPNAVPTPARDTTAPAPSESRQVATTPDTLSSDDDPRERAQRRVAARVAEHRAEQQRFVNSTDGGDAYAPVVRTYDREIAQLRAALRQRADLDSSTVAVLEKNLRLIDEAIAGCRRALARDPHSRVLGDELTRALDLKVEVLRTAVLLPSRSS